jgi:hypothetical protein
MVMVVALRGQRLVQGQDNTDLPNQMHIPLAGEQNV